MRRVALLLLCLALVSAPLRARAAGAESLSILVAPFEVVAPPGAPLPDVAILLADRLGTKGIGRVVGPGALSVEPQAEPSVADVQAWGAKAQTGLVVVGRSTRLGRRISLDLRVRSSEDGRVLGTHVAEAPRPEDLGRAVEQLANEIIESAESVPSAVGSIPVAAVSAAPEGAPRAPAPGDSGPGPAADGTPEPSAGSSRKASPAPLAIQSDEMEVVQGEAGSRRFLFRNNVRLAQGDMHVFSRRMEAFYPAGADGGPNKMIATGGVRLRQSGRKATCDRATFYPRESRVVCEGRDAELVQGSDRVRGREIEFFLDTDRMIVRGGADVFLEPTTPAESPSAAGSGAAEGGE